MAGVAFYLIRRAREVCGGETLWNALQTYSDFQYDDYDCVRYCPIHIACCRGGLATVKCILDAAESLGSDFLERYLETPSIKITEGSSAKTPLILSLDNRECGEIGKMSRIIVDRMNTKFGINFLRKQFELFISSGISSSFLSLYGYFIPKAATDYFMFEFVEGILGEEALGRLLAPDDFLSYACSERSPGYCKRLIEKMRRLFGDDFLASQFANGDVFGDVVSRSSMRFLQYLVHQIRSVGGSALLAKQFRNSSFDFVWCAVANRRLTMLRFLINLMKEVRVERSLLTRFFGPVQVNMFKYTSCTGHAEALELAIVKEFHAAVSFLVSQLPFISAETARTLLLAKTQVDRTSEIPRCPQNKISSEYRGRETSFTLLGRAVHCGNVALVVLILDVIKRVSVDDKELLRAQFRSAASPTGYFSRDESDVPLLVLALSSEMPACREIMRILTASMRTAISPPDDSFLKETIEMKSYVPSYRQILWEARESKSFDIFCSFFREVNPKGYELQLRDVDERTVTDYNNSHPRAKIRLSKGSGNYVLQSNNRPVTTPVENKLQILNEAIAASESKHSGDDKRTLAMVVADDTSVDIIDSKEVSDLDEDSDNDAATKTSG